MKTTLDLPDDLLMQAKRAALDRSLTLKALVERGLRRELSDPNGSPRSIFSGMQEVDASIWNSVQPDDYVREQRSGWE